MKRPRVCIHWLRRDLRLFDNHGLHQALVGHGDVLPLFIFDTNILGRLDDPADRRVDLIHRTLTAIKTELEQQGSALLVEHGEPLRIWKQLLERFEITAVTTNHDHEPYATQRDAQVADLLRSHGIPFHTYKDISIFERSEVMKPDGGPYTVFTPYARKWQELFKPGSLDPFPSEKHLNKLHKTDPLPMVPLEDLGFRRTDLIMPPSEVSDELLRNYANTRDTPGIHGTSRASVHLRFGTISIRALMKRAMALSPVYANELIWREFFMQILWHFPHPERAFKPAYDRIEWRNNEKHFEAWCAGRTGYPLVDAGMRELEQTGFMHNRVRMVVASFLTKHLLIDWRWGEAWFARKLLDFELSSNNGGWQWASGSGCDAAPYFRVFNPHLQQQRFDPLLTYVDQWVKEYRTTNYGTPIVVHEEARALAIATYKKALEGQRHEPRQQQQLF